MLNRRRKVLRWGSGLAILLVVFIALSNLWVFYSTKDSIFYSPQNIPYHEAALVLGTTRQLKSGISNPFFAYRMDAAAKLYHAGKVKYLILSGDNGTTEYNEPLDMQEALLSRGVPEAALILDYAGFRTLDSVLRCKKVFKQKDFTIISQPFHNARALFICQQYGITAVGFAARDVPQAFSFKTLLREGLARPKAVLDIYVLRTQPRFL